MDEGVTLDDVLHSMGNCLLEMHPSPKYHQPPDRKFHDVEPKKPPKEIFYAKTLMMAAQPVSSYKPMVCSCEYLCEGAVATVKCISCILYDPRSLGYFCDLCFRAKHPWYRATHKYISIDDDESVRNAAALQKAQLQVDRQHLDGLHTVDIVRQNYPKLDIIADDLQVERKLQATARKTVSIESRLMKLRSQLRRDVIADGGHVIMSAHEAAVHIQRMFYGFKIRRLISYLFASRYVKAWDPAHEIYFYYDKISKLSTYVPNRCILQHDIDAIPTVEEAAIRDSKWVLKRSNWRRKWRRRELPVVETLDAVLILQGFARCIIARHQVVCVASRLYCRVFDEETSEYFYANTLTGESTWSKPRVFLTSEPLVFIEASDKRSPRFNRDKAMSGFANSKQMMLESLSKSMS